MQGSRGEERKRTEEMLGRQLSLILSSNLISADQSNCKKYFSCDGFFPRLTFPDWLVVKHLGECMDKDNFADLINMMANNLDDVDVDEEKVVEKISFLGIFSEQLYFQVSNDSTLPLKTKFTDRFKGRKSDV